MAVFLVPALSDCWGALRSSEALADAELAASEAEEEALDSAVLEASEALAVAEESAGCSQHSTFRFLRKRVLAGAKGELTSSRCSRIRLRRARARRRGRHARRIARRGRSR